LQTSNFALFKSCGDLGGKQQVGGTVGFCSGRRTHRAGHDDGLRCLKNEAQEESRFFHSVGSVGDDDAVDTVAGEEFLDSCGECEPDGCVNIVGIDVADLFGRDICNVGEARHGGNQLFGGNGSRLVADILARFPGAGNRSARSKDNQVLFLDGGLGCLGFNLFGCSLLGRSLL